MLILEAAKHLHAFHAMARAVDLSSGTLDHKEPCSYHQRPSLADRRMIADYMASEISMIEQGMGGDRAVEIWVSRASVRAEVDGKMVDSANDGNQEAIGFDTFLKDDHHGVPRYRRLTVEVIYFSDHEAEEGSEVFVRDLEIVNENIC